MAALTPLEFNLHLQNLIHEFQHHKSIYGHPARNFYHAPDHMDTAVRLFGKTAATPLGPAAGPHTQLAQNIVLSWLHGSRFIELKTVQFLDTLNIPRPCIDMRNIGYNVEWSQELTLKQSFREYAHAWVLIHLLPHMGIFKQSAGDPFFDTIFDMSLGYDLEGIASSKVGDWLQNMKNARSYIEQILDNLPGHLDHLKEAKIPSALSDSVTLSTFHGCPPDEIEQIVRFLIEKHHLNVIVKLNPTLAGYDFVNTMLRDQLGYKHIRLVPQSFETDLQFSDALAMMQRLQKFAHSHGRQVGVKFTNTLVVENSENIFKEEQRYLSGPPLFVIATHLVHSFREAFDGELPVSFSGGIDKDNFADAVACGLVPVTTCSDLLKKGGYKKLERYMFHLQSAMQHTEALTIQEFITNSAPPSSENPALNNSRLVAKKAGEEPRYRYAHNQLPPKKGQTELTLFDCLTCKICLPVCPNAANFTYFSRHLELPVHTWKLEHGKPIPEIKEQLVLEKDTQIGNIAEFCNECGNCDTFCPELGGPYLQKARFYLKQQNFEQSDFEPAFYFSSADCLHARLEGSECQLTFDPKQTVFLWQENRLQVSIDLNNTPLNLTPGITFDDRLYLTCRTIFEGIRRQATHYPQALILHSYEPLTPQ